MEVVATTLPGVVVLQPKVFGDARGFFVETWREQWARQIPGNPRFVQGNHSRSRQGVLRGLHFQLQHPQGKLVRTARGEVFDVAVDVRVGSPSFGHWVGVVLSDVNHHQLYVPPGFAHGFCVLSETADFLYQCTDYYHPEDEGGVLWNDPALGIEWPVTMPTLSAKDGRWLPLAEVPHDRLPRYRGDEI
ncbi:MAG: dTDP-4-dehydrorhamnose 3,5-epimerase [Alphaproteobacteria bacterium CG_4_10_14_0_2_um_filter_63_37]|nr:MAG: dTDP-4-dehydrorhamnose 3,5-epimerase [Alphaproteobacteria bacterium CG_4_10_14_0_2_um_filter_63_37]